MIFSTFIVGINSTVVFLLELVMLYAFGRYGYTLAGGNSLGYVVALLFLIFAVTIWGIWAAPKSKKRLPMPYQAFLRLLMFGLTALCLFLLGATFFSVTVLVLAILTQWIGWMTDSN